MMSSTRREFLELGLKATAALILNLRMSSAQASGLEFSFSSLFDMANFVVPDPLTLQYSVGSPCCTFCYHKYRVFHYQPVAFVEVIRSDNDSVFGGGGGLTDFPTSTVHSDGKWIHGFQARVWDLPQTAIDLGFGLQACRLCGKPDFNLNPAQMLNTEAVLSGLASTLCGGLMSEAMDMMKSQLMSVMSQLANLMPVDCIPRILYDTTADPHWISGCRDIGMAQLFSQLCEIPGMGEASSAMDAVSLNPFNPCVGSWGSVLPRQYRVMNHDLETASAITAYRAIHVAAHTYKTFPYDASLRGKLQQVKPLPSIGLFPGINKEIFNASRLSYPGHDGKWVFVWWVPVGCCKRLWEIYGLCPPPIPCMPGGVI